MHCRKRRLIGASWKRPEAIAPLFTASAKRKLASEASGQHVASMLHSAGLGSAGPERLGMGLYFFPIQVALTAVVALAACPIAVRAQNAEPQICTEDAMIVFDASGSMYGDGWGYASTSTMSRIDNARAALAKVLPNVTRVRRVGLITYGPGPYNQCNVKLELKPAPNTADRIMGIVNDLAPAGKTPLTSAVEQAANVLDYREKPGVIVLLTDGEETCGRSPCELAKEFRAEASQLTIHVIGLRVKNFSWTGNQSMLETECLAEQNNGLYIAPETEDELVAAFEKTLGCPMISQRAAAIGTSQY